MAFVRKRITKAGSVSTTLVEAYRDDQGRPRQRVLANLHGESDTLCALDHIPLNSHHPNKKVRYSTPSIATVAPLPRKSGCQGQATVRRLDRKKRQLRSKAPMAAAANKSQAAIRMIPPVGA